MRASIAGMLILLTVAGGAALFCAQGQRGQVDSPEGHAASAASARLLEVTTSNQGIARPAPMVARGTYFKSRPRQSELSQWLLAADGEVNPINFTPAGDQPKHDRIASESGAGEPIPRRPEPAVAPESNTSSSRFDDLAAVSEEALSPPVGDRFRIAPPAAAASAFNDRWPADLGGLARLPRVDLVSESYDIVQFAAGGIEFQVPAGWKVAEALVQREVRLMVTPDAMGSARPDSFSGFWVTYRAMECQPTAEQSRAWLTRRRALLHENMQPVGDMVSTNVAGHPAWRQQSTRRDAPEEGQPANAYLGDQIVIATDWGLVELVTIGRESEFSRIREAAEFSLATLKLRQPDNSIGEPSADLADAREILGTWKAYRSRLRLRSDGRVQMVFDGPRLQQLDASRSQYERPPQSIAGRFQASGDLIVIQWADASQLSLRWKTEDGQLLLTDHQGRISKLNRLFE